MASIEALREHLIEQNRRHSPISLATSHKDSYASHARAFTVSADPDDLKPVLKHDNDRAFHTNDTLPDLKPPLSPSSQSESLSTIPVIIQLQEVDAYALPYILSHPWIQRHFLLSTIDGKNDRLIGAGYFTATLVDKRLSSYVLGFRRLRLPRTGMGRDVLLLDLVVEPSHGTLIRFASTHLESLNFHNKRPDQLKYIAGLMKEQGVVAAVVTGDFNPIGAADGTLVEDVGLTDLWSPSPLLGEDADPGESDPQEGHGAVAESRQQTWGYWPRSSFPPRRFDKICVSGGAKLAFGRVARIAVGAQATFEMSLALPGDEDENRAPTLDTLWLSDHTAVEAFVEWSSPA